MVRINSRIRRHVNKYWDKGPWPLVVRINVPIEQDFSSHTGWLVNGYIPQSIFNSNLTEANTVLIVNCGQIYSFHFVSSFSSLFSSKPSSSFSSSLPWKVIIWSSIYSTLASITPRPGHACFSTITFVIIVVVITATVVIIVINVVIIIVIVITMRCGSGDIG